MEHISYVLLIPQLIQPGGAARLDRTRGVEVAAEIVGAEPPAMNVKGTDVKLSGPMKIRSEVQLEADIGQALINGASSSAAGYIAQNLAGLDNLKRYTVMIQFRTQPSHIAKQGGA